MVYLLSGGTHAGKTLWAQRLMEAHGCPYLLIHQHYPTSVTELEELLC